MTETQKNSVRGLSGIILLRKNPLHSRKSHPESFDQQGTSLTLIQAPGRYFLFKKIIEIKRAGIGDKEEPWINIETLYVFSA